MDAVTRILVPYHLDEYLPGLDVPLTPEATLASDLDGGDVWDRLGGLYDDVADAVADDVRAGQVPVVMSGDCTTSLGVVAGLQRAGVDPAIVWFDAHGDVQTLETTTSGYLGGIPLRILAGYRPELISARLRLRPVAEEDIALVDARDLDPPEREYLDRAAIRHVQVADLAADVLPGRPVYLHLDLDVLGSDQLPGLLFPAPGGPSFAVLRDALARLMGTGRVVAVGLGCTWRPGEGTGERVRSELGTTLGGG